MRTALAMAGLGLVLSVAGLIFDAIGLLRAWFVAAQLFLSLPLGALMILMVAELTGGRWAEAIRPIMLAMAGLLPLALLCFVPLLVAPAALFPWLADPAHLSQTASRKLAYLNSPGLELRFLACAVLWLALCAVLGVWRGGEPLFGRRSVLSGLGLALHALLFTVFATDWMQALEPDFYSTIYPMLVASEHLVLALAAAILLLPRPERRGGTPEATLGEDLSKILLAATFVWAYLAFMQWVVIWSGDLPDEIGWYLVRMNKGWQVLLWAVVILGFVVPFVGLVGPRGKRDPRLERAIVVAALIGQLLEGIWRLAPAFGLSPSLLWLLPAIMTMGGVGYVGLRWLEHRPARLEGGVHGALR